MGFQNANNSVRIYDVDSDSWSNGTAGGGTEQSRTSFAVGGNVYGGTGEGALIDISAWYEYDVAADSWTTKGNVPWDERRFAVGFATDSNGYVALGETETGFSSTVHEYDHDNDTWTNKGNFPGTGRIKATTVHNSGTDHVYMGGGTDSNGSVLPDFWRYDASSDSWTQLPDFPGTDPGREHPASFEINGIIYYGMGEDTNGTLRRDVYEFDPSTDTWGSQIADYPGFPEGVMKHASLGDAGYVNTEDQHYRWPK
jgi:N-acetylneuraminic acid mutarotase